MQQITRLWNICQALFISKFHHTVHHIYFILWFFALPLQAALALSFLHYVSIDFDVSTLDPYNLTLYANAVVLDDIANPETELGETMKELADVYEGVAMLAGATILTAPLGIETFLMLRRENSKLKTYVAAATFHERSITAWYNRELFHGSPLSLSLVYKAIGIAGASIDIDVSNKPRADTEDYVRRGLSSAKPAVLMTIYLAIIMPFFGTFVIQDRVSHIRHQQIMTNSVIITYWLLNLLWDFVLYSLIVISIVIAIYWQTDQLLTWIMILLVFFGFSAIAFIYLLSTTITGLTFLVSINLCIGNENN